MWLVFLLFFTVSFIFALFPVSCIFAVSLLISISSIVPCFLVIIMFSIFPINGILSLSMVFPYKWYPCTCNVLCSCFFYCSLQQFFLLFNITGILYFVLIFIVNVINNIGKQNGKILYHQRKILETNQCA